MKTIARYIALTLLALLTTACSQFKLAVVNMPTHFDNIIVHRGVAFGPADWQKLDIHMPPAATEKPAPVIVFYYGGRWTNGARADYRFVGSALARAGYIVVIPDTRKYPDVKFPTFIHDTAQSLAWVTDNIEKYGGDPRAIHLSGHSSGAHMAALVATDPRYLAAQGKDINTVIRSFVGLAGPYAFIPHEPDLQVMFGPPENYPQMQVPTFINGTQPPMLLLWGADDIHVGQFNMDKLSAAIDERGGCVRTKIYPGVDHVWLLARLSWLRLNNQSVLPDWLEFIRGTGCPTLQSP
ncbi:MAG: alpha/beta hydrolase [Alphaproteobacteria bacterium]|nr:alpha/beta hydrolase [Alphaproteobacteria bacterium]